MSADVIPLRDEPDGEWIDVAYSIPPPLPRIPAGSYQARSVALRKREAFKRKVLVLEFDVYRGDSLQGDVLARLPMFLRLPGPRGLSPNSKLARIFYVLYAGTPPSRWGRLPLSVLRGKLWRVQVADAEKDVNDDDLPEAAKYSVVVHVLERLA